MGLDGRYIIYLGFGSILMHEENNLHPVNGNGNGDEAFLRGDFSIPVIVGSHNQLETEMGNT